MLKYAMAVVSTIVIVFSGTTLGMISNAEKIEETPSLEDYFGAECENASTATEEKMEVPVPVATPSYSTATTVTELIVTTETTEATTTTTCMTTTEELTEATTEETTTTEETSYDVNSNDVFLIAYAMSREAAYGDYTDATYVGNVIVNRVNDPDFPDSVSEVLSQEGQYPWGVSFYDENLIYDEYFYHIAEELLAGNCPLPTNVVYQARFPQGSGTYCTLGAHFYCYK